MFVDNRTFCCQTLGQNAFRITRHRDVDTDDISLKIWTFNDDMSFEWHTFQNSNTLSTFSIS